MEKSENAVKDKPVLLHLAPESVSSLKVNEKSKRANLFGTATLTIDCRFQRKITNAEFR
jgi:hypothetical protein